MYGNFVHGRVLILKYIRPLTVYERFSEGNCTEIYYWMKGVWIVREILIWKVNGSQVSSEEQKDKHKLKYAEKVKYHQIIYV